MFRQGLSVLLKLHQDIEVVGEAGDGREAIEGVAQAEPDVVMMDIAMPNLNGLEATRQIKRSLPQVKILALSMHTDNEYVYQVLRAGASGYLLKKSAADEMIMAIRAVHQGDYFLSPAISKEVIEGYIDRAAKEEETFEPLTSREREVLQLIAEGHTNKEVAQILHISEKTVEHHRANLMGKLDIHNLAELIKYALRKGIISLDT